MQPEVTPISMTLVNWPSILNAPQFAGAIRKINELGLRTDSLSSYAQILGHVEERGIPLSHVSFGFLISAIESVHTEMIRTMMSGHWIGGRDLKVYTETVERWQEFVHRLCQNTEKAEVRTVGNRIFEYLEQAGFRPDYNKQALSDGTFVLCRNKSS